MTDMQHNDAIRFDPIEDQIAAIDAPPYAQIGIAFDQWEGFGEGCEAKAFVT